MVDFDELNDFAEWETKRVANALHKTNDEMISIEGTKFLKSVKEYLREIKKKQSRMNISKRYAEVIILSTLLAKRLNVDVNQSVDNMVDAIRARRYE